MHFDFRWGFEFEGAGAKFTGYWIFCSGVFLGKLSGHYDKLRGLTSLWAHHDLGVFGAHYLEQCLLVSSWLKGMGASS